MDVELRFRKEDSETKDWLLKVLGITDAELIEVNSFDGSSILIALLVGVELLIKNPKIIDKFLTREGCEVIFNEEGKLLRAKGYSVADILKLKASEVNFEKEEETGDVKSV